MGAGETNLEVEQRDDRVRKAREIVERFNDTDRLYERGFMDRYALRDFQIVCRPISWRSLFEGAQYGLVISRQNPRIEIGDESVAGKVSGNGEAGGPHDDFQQSLMFPLDVELMKEPKTIIPSFVRLQRLDNCSFGLRERIYKLFPLKLGVNKGRVAPSYGKIDIVQPRYVVPFRQSAREQVETTSDGIEVGPELDMKGERERLLLTSYYGIVSGWRWLVFDNHIHIVVQPSGHSVSEVWELGFGPINACLSF